MSEENKDMVYEVPQEIKDLFFDSKVANTCKDRAIESFFRAKRAIYYGRIAQKASDKAWKLFKELYPDTFKGIKDYSDTIEYSYENENVIRKYTGK